MMLFMVRMAMTKSWDKPVTTRSLVIRVMIILVVVKETILLMVAAVMTAYLVMQEMTRSRVMKAMIDSMAEQVKIF